ncbi:helix-turn-helix transcriptional regulator [Flavobacterium jejuense]|uniref:Helix-turn-helix transcriptional regulator n=1 Tax=Flavobacterium jejuense TaxID=1544455 RepID=A0ABX0IKJ7_9FLAO|nr:AraC family transcriptional regulator [Flavobacterium jejuense]NHN24344.1 helix-turn-helix transcriptional regulator [Flavobacterium jejuense]
MTKLELPNFFLTTKTLPEVYAHYFVSDAYSTKTKIQLNTNLISFLFEGSKELYHENYSKTITENQFVLAKHGNCMMSEKLSDNKKYASLLFFFNDNFITDFKRKYKLISNAENKKQKKQKKFKVLEYDSFIKNFVISMRQLLDSNTKMNEFFFKLKLEEILYYLVQKKEVEILNFFSTTPIQKHHIRLKNTVENNIFSKLTLEELAFLSHMSLSTFKREFNKIYGMSPSKWIQEKRLEKSAQMLLIEKERPIDVYATIGYESLSSFTQSFKHKFGITPKQYQIQELS